MDKKELPFLTAIQLSKLIETKEVSPVEATQAYLDRIQEVDPKLNSYITITGEQALEAARQAEQEIAEGVHRGPLHGVPMAVKDQFNTAGVPTTGGSSILRDNVPAEDATVITKLKNAGAILLGKLNMSEFAMAEIYNHPYGTPRNPWDLERNPGTSSSGSGAATAASLCATSLGEDTGGSIRGPANFSGLVGLRPSHGRVSRYGVLGGSWSMDTVGPISKSVEDAAITIQAIAGHDPKDTYSWDVPVPDYLAALTGDISGIKLGVVQERMDSPNLDPEFRDTVAKAISVLGELGASSEDVSIPLAPNAGALTMSILNVEWSNLHRPLFEPNIDELDHNNKIRFLTGSVIPAQFYYKAQKIRAMLRQQILDALEKVDVLVLPTGPVTAPPVESVPGIQSKEHALTGLAGRISFTGPFNLAGTPAISVPCGFSAVGMPMGLQIVGRSFAEETVLKVAHAYEQNTDWHNRRAPV
ncbi:MAG: Asp-tRNA(Asn)/Glu-tRNA(Gln) amidotransferase GatCAB subunit A [Chloroflexi bacterium]|jgi:aspartyl-tRNA(Asn)/glutamyl-tRNA(Gln) amidotransferase subunit A|nr:Asp-tRNA(Asn)/Glu-tRNA(Gln) amidotransferase GatCAB subunit A [Chloroflexota bacterium]MDP6498126.1 amidase [Dehalococcoidia bacterium]MQG55215.1 aspartyl/glutamyl-tRNA amidotransferase subunit A [SAR202 cluster bacterium]|tara:strand:+ start:29035 stop:30450 length:1416 start_codon:yes stop_codon:yes gene_type:complete